MRVLVIVCLLFCVLSVNAGIQQIVFAPPSQASLTIDETMHDEAGKVIGWQSVLSINLATNSVSYELEGEAAVSYTSPSSALAPYLSAVKQLAVNTITREYIPAKHGIRRRLQYWYSDTRGTSASGLYLYNADDELPAELQSLLGLVFGKAEDRTEREPVNKAPGDLPALDLTPIDEPPASVYMRIYQNPRSKEEVDPEWPSLFSIGLSTGVVRHRPGSGELVEYAVPAEITAVYRVAVRALILKIITGEYVSARKAEAGQFLALGCSGSLAPGVSIGRFYFKDTDQGMPKEARSIVDFASQQLPQYQNIK
jgi:hypothetical protein